MRLKTGWALTFVALLTLPATASAQSNDTTVKAPAIVQGPERATRSASLERADDQVVKRVGEIEHRTRGAIDAADLARVDKAIRDAYTRPVDVVATKSAHLNRVLDKRGDEHRRNEYFVALTRRLQNGQAPLGEKIHQAKQEFNRAREKYDDQREEHTRANGQTNQADKDNARLRREESNTDHMDERNESRRERKLEAQQARQDNQADAQADKAQDRADAKADAKQEAQDERKREMRDERHSEQTDERRNSSTTGGTPGSK
jgi:hypothetical protein